MLLLLGNGGIVESTFAVPGIAALIGVQLWNQVLSVELLPTMSITRVTASNALALTVGTL